MGYTTGHRSRRPTFGVPDTGHLLNSTTYQKKRRQQKAGTCLRSELDSAIDRYMPMEKPRKWYKKKHLSK